MMPETLTGQCGYFFGLGFGGGLTIAVLMQIWGFMVTASKVGVGSFDGL